MYAIRSYYVQRHYDLIGIGDDVIVGEYVAAGAHDDARAQALGQQFGRATDVGALEATGVDVHHGRTRPAGGIGVAERRVTALQGTVSYNFV